MRQRLQSGTIPDLSWNATSPVSHLLIVSVSMVQHSLNANATGDLTRILEFIYIFRALVLASVWGNYSSTPNNVACVKLQGRATMHLGARAKPTFAHRAIVRVLVIKFPHPLRCGGSRP